MGTEKRKKITFGRIAALCVSLLLILSLTLSLVWDGYYPFWDSLFRRSGLRSEKAASFDKVIFLDVGQGDCSLIASRDKYILIDTGPSDRAVSTARELKRLCPGGIDTVVISHPHQDHLGGLAALLGEVEIGRIILGGNPPTEAEDISARDAALSLADKAGVAVSAAPLTSRQGNCELRFFEAEEDASDNDASLVIRAAFDSGLTALFTGDCSAERLEALDRDYLHCDLLKVPHHGSESSVSEELYNSIMPRFAVISCGEYNPYGHPSDALTEILEKNSVTYRRTDVNGTVTFSVKDMKFI